MMETSQLKMRHKNIFILIIFTLLLLTLACNNNDDYIPYIETIVPQIDHHYHLNKVVLSKYNKYLASAGKKEIIVSEVNSGIILHRFKLPINIIDVNITELYFNKDKTILYAISETGNEIKQLVFNLKNSALIGIKDITATYTKNISSKLLSQINNKSLSRTAFTIYDSDSNHVRLSDEYILSPLISDIAISSDKRYIALLGTDNKIRLWDVFNVGVISIIALEEMNKPNEITALSFNYNKDRLYALTKTGHLFEWDTQNLDEPQFIKQSIITEKLHLSPIIVDTALNNEGDTALILTTQTRSSSEFVLHHIPVTQKHNENSTQSKELPSQPRCFSLNNESDVIGIVYGEASSSVALYDNAFRRQSVIDAKDEISSISFGCGDEIMICYETAPYIDFYSQKGNAKDRVNLVEKHYHKVSSFCSNFIVLSNDYGELFLYNIYNRDNIFKLMFYNDENFIIFSDDGYFDTSNIDKVKLVKGLDVMSEDALMKYYKPEKIKKTLFEFIGSVSY